MDLINELRTDIVIAFLTDKAHTQKVDSLGAKLLIERFEDALAWVSERQHTDRKGFAASAAEPSH